MIVTKMSLPRRTVLRGIGVTLALPLLDAMVPALTASAWTAAKPAPRLVVWGTANGVHRPHFLPAGDGLGEGLGELSPILTPLAPYREQMVVASGCSNSAADTKDTGGGPHARGAGAFLSGVRPHRTEGADVRSGKTVDQYAADVLGKDTQLTSLELSLESSFIGNCDQGYSCAYINTFSWRTPTTPNPMENNPRIVFERLFGDGGSVSARKLELQKDRSVLDWISSDINRLQKRVGPADRLTVTEYLETVRDVERRLQKAEQQSANTELPEELRPVGIPDSFDDHFDLMVDLQALALQADVTRVMSLQTSREQSGRQFPFIGVAESHHVCSHNAGDDSKIQGYTKINAYFMEKFAKLAGKLRATPDGEGSLLDHSMMFWGSTLGDGDLHSIHDLPAVFVGGACGQLAGGRYLKYPLDTPFMNLWLSMLDKLGAEVDQIGDSTGRLAGV